MISKHSQQVEQNKSYYNKTHVTSNDMTENTYFFLVKYTYLQFFCQKHKEMGD